MPRVVSAPRMRLIVTNLETPSRMVVWFYSNGGTAPAMTQFSEAPVRDFRLSGAIRGIVI